MKIGILPISSMEKSPNCFPRHTLPRSSSRASACKDLIWPRLQAFNSFWPWRFAMTTPQKKKLTWQRNSFIIQPLISNLCFQGGPSFCLVDFPCLPGTLKIFARHKPWKMSPEVSWQHGLENHLDKWAEGRWEMVNYDCKYKKSYLLHGRCCCCTWFFFWNYLKLGISCLKFIESEKNSWDQTDRSVTSACRFILRGGPAPTT